ncbi:hypothetical protein AB9K41_21160 [Cribrihabitans sp. XS_ASV171]
MKLRLTASALALIVAAPAFADDNQAYSDQNGTGNSLLIEQQGSMNQAGTAPDGGDLDAITQDGDNNDAEILQVGDMNRVGTGNNGSASQQGDDNVFDIDQMTSENNVGLVRQNSASADGSSDTENELTVLQNGGDDNNVSISIQNNDGGSANTAALTQTGTGKTLRGRLTQLGSGNSATLDQIGDNNRVDEILQGETRGPDIFSDDNTASLSFLGNGNGTTSLTGVAAVTDDRKVIQFGDGNYVGLDVVGDNNAFGTSQVGDMNSINNGVVGMAAPIMGDDNAFGAMQTGTNNDIAVLDFNGNGNTVGATQTGVDNTIELTLLQDDNIVDLDQESNAVGNEIEAMVDGNMNELIVNQTVGASANASSTATVDITGDMNYLNVQQNSIRSLSGPQTVMVSIDGDNNNNSGILTAFSGDAATVAGSLVTPGDIFQEKNGSLVSLDVTGNDNLFATYQSGNPGGEIMGTINGNQNQAVVTQVGATNMASFSQVGNMNNLGIMQ